MTQAGAFAAGIFGGAKQDVPFQRIDETSYSDGSLGAIDLSAPRQNGAYRAGVLGSVAQAGAYRSGSLGDAASAAAAAAAASRKFTALTRGKSTANSSTSFSTYMRNQCYGACNTDYHRHKNKALLMQCRSRCVAVNPVSGLGMFENLPTWAPYAAGGAALIAGYFLFVKKKR
jgi:hypothetical protein